MDFFSFFLGVSTTLIKVFLIHLSGYLLAFIPFKSPILTNSFLSDLSSLVVYIFMPCLIFSKFILSMSIYILSTSWILIIWGLITPIIGVVIGFVVPKILHIHPSLHRAIVLTCGVQNGINFPILYIQGLCENVDEFSTIEDCSPISASYMFIQSIGFMVIFFGYIFQYLHGKKSDNEIEMKHKHKEKQSWVSYIKEILIKYYLLITIFTSLFIGMSRSLSDIFINGFLSPLQSSLTDIGKPTVVVSSIIFGALIGSRSNLPGNLSDKTNESETKTKSDIVMSTINNDNDDDDDFYSSNNSLLIFLVCLIKLVIVPFIGFSLIFIVFAIGGDFQRIFFPSDKLLRLVVIIQFGSPSANIVLITLSKISIGSIRRLKNVLFVSRLFFWIYLMSVFSILGWTLLAIEVINL